MKQSILYLSLFVLFVLTIFEEGAYVTFKPIFNKPLKDGIIAS